MTSTPITIKYGPGPSSIIMVVFGLGLVLFGNPEDRADGSGNFVEVWALGPAGFTPIWEETASTVTEAQAKGEAYARSMGCLK